VPAPETADAEVARTQGAAFDEMLRLGGRPNVALKWAHAQYLFRVTDYPFAGLRPILRRALDAFGPERVMWASDFSAVQSENRWGELLFWLRDNPDLSADEREGLLGRNLRAWLDWRRG
jgi:predicted TIM-barrel fold metal-dependent hydrolase